MKDKIQLIVGLGNPGSQYAKTRHNAGAEFVEQFAAQQLISLQADKKFFGLYGKTILNNQTIHILIPTTFMNLSGQAVSAIANFYKIPPENILVAHDELDLPPGTARLKMGGGHGGHNGLRDIISKLANNRNFYRLRLGIGHPGHSNAVADFVLSKASISERNSTQAAIEEAIHYLPEAVSGDWAKAMNKLHSFKG